MRDGDASTGFLCYAGQDCRLHFKQNVHNWVTKAHNYWCALLAILP